MNPTFDGTAQRRILQAATVKPSLGANGAKSEVRCRAFAKYLIDAFTKKEAIKEVGGINLLLGLKQVCASLLLLDQDIAKLGKVRFERRRCLDRRDGVRQIKGQMRVHTRPQNPQVGRAAILGQGEIGLPFINNRLIRQIIVQWPEIATREPKHQSARHLRVLVFSAV